MANWPASADGSDQVTTPRGLDELDTGTLVDALLVAQNRVPAAVSAARDTLGKAVDLLVESVRAGGRLIFVGAGTSGRLALMEAAELPGTFGVAPDIVLGLLAGMTEFGLNVGDYAEDDVQLAAGDMRRLAVDSPDCVIAIAASGSTPYTVSAAAEARSLGASIVSITTGGESPLARAADVAVEVTVGAEVLDGSTRMAAGTAQKIVLNTLTTAAMVRLGHVHGRYMVDVDPANEKLRSRAVGIVASVADVDTDRAADAMNSCRTVRAAIIHLVLGEEPEQARRLALDHTFLRDALRS